MKSKKEVNHLNKRDKSFDALRGISIIAVVAIHATSYTFKPDKFQVESLSLFLALLYRQLLNFAVPTFIFISGYWVSSTNINSIREYKKFLKIRLLRVLIPYIFWSVTIILIYIFRDNYFDFQGTLIKLLTGSTIGPYYFVILISQFYILTPLFHLINKKSYGYVLSIIINLLSLAFIYILKLYLDLPLSLTVYALPFYSWIIFYELGMLVKARNYERFFEKSSKKYLILVIISIVITILLCILEADFLFFKYNDPSFAMSAVKCSSFLYSISFILGFLFIKRYIKKWPKTIVLIGEYSFGIYLIHILVLEFFAEILDKSFLNSMQCLFHLALVINTIIICCVVIFLSKKMIPKKVYSKILGF